MKRILTMVSVVAMVSLSIYACKSKDEVLPSSNAATSSGLRTLDDECEECCEDVQYDSLINNEGLTRIESGVYTNWTAFSKELCGVGAQFQLEGQYNSFLKGINGWNVSVIDPNDFSYSDDLEDITDCENVVAAIDPGVNGYGSVGLEDYPNSGDPGYYTYPCTACAPSFTKLLAVWKCCPENGTVKVYVVKVTGIVPTGPQPNGPFGTKVYYEYKCFTCTATCPTL